MNSNNELLAIILEVYARASYICLMHDMPQIVAKKYTQKLTEKEVTVKIKRQVKYRKLCITLALNPQDE